MGNGTITGEPHDSIPAVIGCKNGILEQGTLNLPIFNEGIRKSHCTHQFGMTFQGKNILRESCSL